MTVSSGATGVGASIDVRMSPCDSPLTWCRVCLRSGPCSCMLGSVVFVPIQARRGRNCPSAAPPPLIIAKGRRINTKQSRRLYAGQAYMGATIGQVSIGLITPGEGSAPDPTSAAIGGLVGVGSLLLVSRSVVPALLAKGEEGQKAKENGTAGEAAAVEVDASTIGPLTPSPRHPGGKKKA